MVTKRNLLMKPFLVTKRNLLVKLFLVTKKHFFVSFHLESISRLPKSIGENESLLKSAITQQRQNLLVLP